MALLRKCQPSGILPVSQPSAQENRSGKRSQRRRNVTAPGPMELLLFKVGQSWRAGAATGMRGRCSAFRRSLCATAAACRGWSSASDLLLCPLPGAPFRYRHNCVLSCHRQKETSNITVLDWFMVKSYCWKGNHDRGEHSRIPAAAAASRCGKHRHTRPQLSSPSPVCTRRVRGAIGARTNEELRVDLDG